MTELPPPISEEPDDDDRSSSPEVEVAILLEAYLSDLHAGRPVDPDRLLADHPDLASDLRACLDVLGRPEAAQHPTGSTLPSSRVHLPDPPGVASAPTLSRPGLPAQAGRYQVLGEIARGGMGVVLRARDHALGRELAVKVLLGRHRDDPSFRDRFVEEAQIGGQLQHPGIVPVYELGAFADGRPFLAMKLVQGRTLAALLDERPHPRHDLPRFLDVVEHASQAVAYAHARRVIHRDLKPSNVMVGSFGEVQVMDWGLAKVILEGGVLDEPDPAPVRTARTEGSGSESVAGSVLGTPAYMAPEQARGEPALIDERADVFALGAILCQLLTGRPPYLGDSRAEVHARAARADLDDAYARLDASQADPDLVRVARDCLAPLPQQRPRDAGVVARRIADYTAGVQQRLHDAEIARARAQAQALEEKRRRRLTLGLASALATFLLTVASAAAWWAHDRQARADRLDASVQTAAALLEEARANSDDQARWSVALIAANQLPALLDAAPSRPPRALALLADARKGAADADADRTLLSRLAAIHVHHFEATIPEMLERYSQAFRDRGLDPDAIPTPRLARQIRERSPRYAATIASHLDTWAGQRRLAGDPEGAARLLAVARDADPDPWRNRLRDACDVSDEPHRLAAILRLAREPSDALSSTSALALGVALSDLDQFAAAESVLRPARDREPSYPWLNLALAHVLRRLGRTPEAIRYGLAAQAVSPMSAHRLSHHLLDNGELESACVVLRGLTRGEPHDPGHLSCLRNVLTLRGLTEEAAAVAASQLSVVREQVRLHPDSPQARFALGVALQAQGQLDAAIEQYRETVRLNPSYVNAHINIGAIQLDRLPLDDAVASIREAVRLQPRNPGAHHNLGLALDRMGQTGPAIEEYREAIRLQPDDHHPHVGLAVLLSKLDRHEEALIHFREAVRLQPRDPNLHHNLGLILARLGRHEAAVEEYREAVRLKPDFGLAYTGLSKSFQELKRDEDAVAALAEAVRLQPLDEVLHYNFGVDLVNQGKHKLAAEQFREAVRLNPDDLKARFNLGLVLGTIGEVETAIAAYRELIRLHPEFHYTYLNLGIMLANRGDLDAAILTFEQGIPRAADDPVVLQNLQKRLDAARLARKPTTQEPASPK